MFIQIATLELSNQFLSETWPVLTNIGDNISLDIFLSLSLKIIFALPIIVTTAT